MGVRARTSEAGGGPIGVGYQLPDQLGGWSLRAWIGVHRSPTSYVGSGAHIQDPFGGKTLHLSHWQALTLPAPRRTLGNPAVRGRNQ